MDSEDPIVEVQQGVNDRKSQEESQSAAHRADKCIKVHQGDGVAYVDVHVRIVDVNLVAPSVDTRLLEREGVIVIVGGSPFKHDVILDA